MRFILAPKGLLRLRCGERREHSGWECSEILSEILRSVGLGDLGSERVRVSLLSPILTGAALHCPRPNSPHQPGQTGIFGGGSPSASLVQPRHGRDDFRSPSRLRTQTTVGFCGGGLYRLYQRRKFKCRKIPLRSLCIPHTPLGNDREVRNKDAYALHRHWHRVIRERF